MGCYVHVIGQTAEVWVPRHISADIVHACVAHYQTAGYQVVVYYSGSRNLAEQTGMLLRCNMMCVEEP